MQSDQYSALWLRLKPLLSPLAFFLVLALVVFCARFLILELVDSFDPGLVFYGVVSISLLILSASIVALIKLPVRQSMAIIAGYITACLITGFALVLLDFVSRGLGQFDIESGLVLSVFAFVLMILPASLTVWYVERTGTRSPIFYAIVGAIAGAPTYSEILEVSSWWMCAIGALAGLICWAIAGRNAGAWRNA